MSNIEKLKSEISDKYLDDFKNELWTIKSLVLLPIKKDIKKILTGQADLPQKFDEVKEFGRWKDIINFVTPDIASQIFAFMKEKRTQIETRKTETELEALKQMGKVRFRILFLLKIVVNLLKSNKMDNESLNSKINIQKQLRRKILRRKKSLLLLKVLPLEQGLELQD